MKTDKVRFYVERDSFGAEAMVILMAFSIVFRIIGCWGLWNDRTYAVTQIVLPVVSALMLIMIAWLFGKRALWLSFIPVVLGAVFFIIKAFGFESRVQMVLCILLYIAVIALYFCTVFGIIRTKWILVLLFGLPFLYHIFVIDIAALRDTANPVSFAAGMQEMSILCIMLGMCSLCLSMKKRVTESSSTDLPKMKAPKVLFGQKKNETETESSEPVSEHDIPAEEAVPAADTGEKADSSRTTQN